ncbi:MAG: protein kinase [Myxococcales bacterium]|jgi:serine/threonine-protein kinase|nr:protein kinase [Myxococcales bacterium]MBL0193257.1 protein kinase [Myxococcales bacterium]HQY64984.1 protein kinase [Polyangiaceae bacterium]
MSAQDPFIGRDILDGQFQILQKIGKGGMGAVYKAVQPAMNRMVAVKILHPKFTTRRDLASRFRREARAMSHLTHPNTAKVFLYGELDDGSLYIVMELLEGKNMNQTVRSEGPMPLDRAVAILRQVCAALAEAHAAGIIHRDLKPENVFLCQQAGMKDYAKVLDFGLAKVTEREMRPGSIALTQEGMVFGTPEFMSPEQAQGKKLTAVSDIYSLAVILYEALTGKLPFDAKSGMEFIQHHVMTKPLTLAQRAPNRTFPPLLQAVFDKALEKDPAKRFPTALEFSNALDAVLAGGTELPASVAPPVAAQAPRSAAPNSAPQSQQPAASQGAPQSQKPPSHQPHSARPPPSAGPHSAPAPSSSLPRESLDSPVSLPTSAPPVKMLAVVAVTFLLVGALMAVVAMRLLAK